MTTARFVSRTNLLEDLRAAFASKQWIVLGAITLAGAVLRVIHQIDRPFVFDEVGTLDLLDLSYRSILTEWGPTQTQHYFLLLEKIMFELSGGSALGLVAVPMLAGTLTIPATALLGSLLRAPQAGIAAAVFVAVNPYLIQRSLIIRAYGLQILLVVVLLCTFALWWKSRSALRGSLCAVAAFFAVLVHPNSVYVLQALGVCSLLAVARAALLSEERDLTQRIRVAIRPWWSIALPMLAAAALTIAAYLPIFTSPQQPAWTEPASNHHVATLARAPVGISHVEHVWPSYFGNGYLGWPWILLLLLGGFLAVRRRTPLQALLLLLTIILFAVSARGIHTHSPSDYTRWMAYTLPLLFILIGSALTAWPRLARTSHAVVAALLLATTWLPSGIASYEFKSRFPWNEVRSVVTQSSGSKPPLVLALGLHARVNLGPSDRPEYELAAIRTRQEWQRSDGPIAAVEPGDRVLLVQTQVDLECGLPSTKYGEIRVTPFEVTTPEALHHAVFDCLSQTARRSWSAEESMLPIYDFLVRNAPALGKMKHHLAFVQMFGAVEQQTTGALHRPLKTRKSDARRLSRYFQKVRPFDGN